MSRNKVSLLSTVLMLFATLCLMTWAWGEVRVNVMTPGTQATVAPDSGDNKTKVTLPGSVPSSLSNASDEKTRVQLPSRVLATPLSAKIVPDKLSLKQTGFLTVQGGTAPYTITSSSSFLTVTPAGPNAYQVTQTHNAAGNAILKVRDVKGQEVQVSVKMALTINVK